MTEQGETGGGLFGPGRSREATPRVALTGAGGFVGGALERRLATEARLRGLFRRRSPRTEAWRERGDEVVLGDLSDPDALSSLVKDAAVLYHLAARTAKDDPEASRRVNVEGTRRVVRAAREAGVGRVVYVSTISVYAATEPSDREATDVERRGPPGVQTITEEVEPRRIDLLNPYSATKYRGELAAREAAGSASGVELTVVRPTNVYGPGSEGWVLDWAQRLERVPVAIGRDLPVNLVHVDDVARAVARAGTAEAAAGEALHVGGSAVPLARYLSGLGQEIGRSVYRLPLPVDRLLRLTITAGHRLLNDDRMSTPLTRRVRFPHEKARRLLGYSPRVELEEGVEQVGRWYRDEKAG